MEKHNTKRQRNAVATRQAILESAQAAFTQSGYDGVGLREIAKGAGVTAILVNHYFGSKENLFTEVVESVLSNRRFLTDEIMQAGDDTEFSRKLAEILVTKSSPELAPQVDGFLIMLRSASNERAAAILREKIVQHNEKPLSVLFTGPAAKERTAILLSILAGFQLMRRVIGMPGLTKAKSDTLSQLIQPLFQFLIEQPANQTISTKPKKGSSRKRSKL